MRIIYINYVDCDNQTSGSGVRPLKMLKAFQDLGHEVLFLVGEQFHPERVKAVNCFWNNIKNIEADLCYIESPTYPVVRHADRKLISRIAQKNIPIGYYYRDFYRKFPEQFPRKKGFKGRIKDMVLDVMQYLTDRLLYKCKIVYFPVIEASKLFDYNDMRALPPAGENKIKGEKKLNYVGIYVGGVIEHYNSTLLLDTFMTLYEQNPSYKLIMVCRKEEWDLVNHPCKHAEWLEVHHVSGKDLIPLYERASVGFVMPDIKYEYNQLGISVKTFEYISYGLPVIAVNTRPLTAIINDSHIGLSVVPEKEFVVRAVKNILKDRETYNEWCKKVKLALTEKHLWTHRAQQVVTDLTMYKNGCGQ